MVPEKALRNACWNYFQLTERVIYFAVLVFVRGKATEKLNWIVAKSLSFKFSQNRIMVRLKGMLRIMTFPETCEIFW